MDTDVLMACVSVVTIIVALGGFGLTGWRMWLRASPRLDSAELVDSISRQLRDVIRDEVAVVLEGRESELEELHERLDFTERLLAQAKLPSKSEEREPTPV